MNESSKKVRCSEANGAALCGNFYDNSSFAQLSALKRRGTPIYGMAWTSAQTTSSFVLPVASD